MEEFEKLSKGSAFHQGHCSLLTHHYSPSHIKCVCPHWTVSKGLRKSQQYKVAKLSAQLSFSFPFLSFPSLNFSVFLFHLTLLLHLLSLFPHSSAELSLPAYFSVFRMASPHPPWSWSLVQHFLLVSLVSLSRGLPPFFPSSFHFLNFSSSALFITLPLFLSNLSYSFPCLQPPSHLPFSSSCILLQSLQLLLIFFLYSIFSLLLSFLLMTNIKLCVHSAVQQHKSETAHMHSD